MAEHHPDIRFSLANERTLLAYQRTSIGLMAAAIAVVHFFGDGLLVFLLAAMLIVTGAIAAVGGYVHFRRVDRAIRDDRPDHQRSGRARPEHRDAAVPAGRRGLRDHPRA